MSSSVDRVIGTAKAEVGYTEGRTQTGTFNNNTKYADEVPGLEWADFQPWCATFVAWVALKSGVADLYPKTASCDQAGQWFKARKRWSEYPAVGAQVFYGTPADLNHTGIVIGYTDTDIETIEGNTNDDGSREGRAVMRKRRKRRDDNVVGYGYPLFSEGIRSADPDFAPKRVAANGTRPLSVDGIDISHWQDGNLDFDKAKQAGVKFVVHKATEGTTFEDSRYTQRRQEVARAGLIWGAYHFARPDRSSGAKQAQFLLSRMRPVAADLRPVLDLEKTGGLAPAELNAWTKDFAEEIEMRVGMKPIVYTPFDLAECHGPLWVARYSHTNEPPRIPRPWTDYSIWQFSNGAFGRPFTVPGIGHCDINTIGAKTHLEDLRLR